MAKREISFEELKVIKEALKKAADEPHIKKNKEDLKLITTASEIAQNVHDRKIKTIEDRFAPDKKAGQPKDYREHKPYKKPAYTKKA
jgi:hypothetical protein